MNNYNIDKKEDEKSKGLILKFKLFFKKNCKIASEFKNIDFFKNHIVLWLLLFNFLANLANWAILGFFINKTEGNIILHYNVYFGVDNVGSWKQAFILPAIGDLLFAINFLLAVFFYFNKERIASYILLMTSMVVQLGLIIGSASVIMINY